MHYWDFVCAFQLFSLTFWKCSKNIQGKNKKKNVVKQRESQRIWHGKTPDHSLAASCTIRNLSIDVSSTFDLSAPFVMHPQLILILNHILHSSSTFNTFTLQFQSFMTSDSFILQPFNVDRSLSCKRKKKHLCNNASLQTDAKERLDCLKSRQSIKLIM